MWKLSRRRRVALGVAVDAAEDQRGVAEVELGQAVDQRLVEDVALEAGLERAAEVGLAAGPAAARRRRAGRSRHS